MTRTKKLGALAAIVAGAALVAVFSLRHSEDAGAAAKHDRRHSTAERARVFATGAGGEIATADPVGTLRIEGEVIDDDDQPVGGARVTIDALPPQTVTTEEDGTFVFEHLLERRYRLVAAAQDGVAGPAYVRVTDNGEPVILRMRASADFEVSVIDALTGTAVAGAKVEIRAPVVASAATGANGTATLRAITPGHWPLVVAADGYATGFESVAASATARSTKTIALVRGVHARGRVLDHSGNPIENAVVWLENVSDWVGDRDPERDGARTTSDGRFEMIGVARGSYVLHAIAPDHSTATSRVTRIDGDIDDITLRTEPGAQITGTVVRPDHTQATAATVRASWNGGSRIAHVDRAARFMLEGLPSAPVWLVANDGEGASKPRRIDLAGAAAPGVIELVLENTGVITGTVIDHAGAPVEGAQVTAVRGDTFDAAANAAGTVQELSDSSGRFALHALAAGDYQLSATRDPFHASARKTAMTVAAGTTDVQLVIASSGGIKGSVAFKGGGKPVAYSVRVGRSGLPTSFTSAEFQVEAPPGTQSLWIEGPGFTAISVNGIEVTADAVTDAGAIELDRGRTLSGRVTSPDGMSLVNGEVLAGAMLLGNGQRVDTGENGPEFRDDVKHVTLAADGSFEIVGAAAAPISLVASLASGARSTPVQVPAGHTDIDGITLTVKKEAALSGLVTRDGEPARAIVNAQAQDSPLTMFTVMATDGQYSYDRLAPGRYTVAAIAGAPLSGSPFYPRVVDLAAGKSAKLDIEITAGATTLTVQAPGTASGLVFVTTKPGTATSGLGLIGELGRQDGGAWALTAVRDGSATLRKLPAGLVRVCVVPIEIKGVADMNALVGQIVRAGNSLAAACQTIELGAATTVSIGGSPQ